MAKKKVTPVVKPIEKKVTTSTDKVVVPKVKTTSIKSEKEIIDMGKDKIHLEIFKRKVGDGTKFTKDEFTRVVNSHFSSNKIKLDFVNSRQCLLSVDGEDLGNFLTKG